MIFKKFRVIELENNPATGVEDIPTKVLKMATHVFEHLISHISNRSLIDGIFLDYFKTALIKLIFKAEDKDSVTNYIPIYILPYLSNVFK